MFRAVTHFFSLREWNAPVPPRVPEIRFGENLKTMNLSKKTILALGVLVAGVSFAQTTQTGTTPVGLLGQSFSEIHVGASDIKNFSKDQYGLGVAANVPVTPYLDLGAGYDYGWIRGIGHANTVNGTATAYTTFNGVKPFVSAGLGYQWTRAYGNSDDQGIWGGAVGVEIPVASFTLTPRIAYVDDFEAPRKSSQQTTYEVEGNLWVTKTAAVFASVGYTDVNRTSDDSWNYTVGARFKF